MYWGNNGAAPFSHHTDWSVKSTGPLHSVAIALAVNSSRGLCGV